MRITTSATLENPLLFHNGLEFITTCLVRQPKNENWDVFFDLSQSSPSTQSFLYWVFILWIILHGQRSAISFSLSLAKLAYSK
jgi:hypothetical protein